MQQSIRVLKKPIEVTAMQWTGDNEPFIRQFIGDDALIHFKGNMLEVYCIDNNSWCDVPTFYYIIKGVKGEFYPMSPEIFDRTCEVIVTE